MKYCFWINVTNCQNISCTCSSVCVLITVSCWNANVCDFFLSDIDNLYTFRRILLNNLTHLAELQLWNHYERSLKINKRSQRFFDLFRILVIPIYLNCRCQQVIPTESEIAFHTHTCTCQRCATCEHKTYVYSDNYTIV